MPEFHRCALRRFDPESGAPPYWDEHTIELEPHRSVLEGDPPGEGALRRLDRDPLLLPRRDLRLLRRAHQRPARPRLPHPPRRGARSARADGVIVVEPMGNMPVIKDLIVDMDAVHWKKIQSVTPWLLATRAGARARVPRRPRGDGRRHAVDGVHPVRRVRLGLPGDGGRPRVHRARRRSPRPTASSATRATPSTASA